jgi:Undecaprenyl-phosphate glucose phosphotransferase
MGKQMAIAHAPILLERSKFRTAGSVPIDSLGSLVIIFDWIWIYLLGIASDQLYHAIVLGNADYSPSYLGPGIAVAAIYTAFAHGFDAYRASNLVRSTWQVGRCLLIWTLPFLLLAALAFILKVGDLFSRGEALLFYVNGLVVTFMMRIVVARTCSKVIASRVLALRRIVAIGTSEEILTNEAIYALDLYGYAIVRTWQIDLDESENGNDRLETGLHDIVAQIRRIDPDEVLLALPWDQPALLETVENALRVLPLPVRLVPSTKIGRTLNRPLFDLGPTAAVELQRAPMGKMQRRAKRILDQVLAVIAGVLFLPSLIIVAVAIRLDSPGPILFRQTRMGFNGRPFRIYKFRTMSALDDGALVVQAKKDDARVTRLGRLLRRLSIDEIPQLLNVLRGEMSLVGPRPHAIAHDNEYSRLIDTYALRHRMLPGITGWSQINGFRGETRSLRMMEQRVEKDIWYIEYWSLWLDIRILFLTMFRVLKSPNAY